MMQALRNFNSSTEECSLMSKAIYAETAWLGRQELDLYQWQECLQKQHTPFPLIVEILSAINIHRPLKTSGKILVLINPEIVIALIAFFSVDPANIVFVVEPGKKTALVSKFNLGKILPIEDETDIPIIQERLLQMNKKPIIVVGNPPYNGKTDIHLKFVEMIGKITSKDSYIGLVLPGQIFARQLKRNRKYTGWLDTESIVYEQDCSASFPKIGDQLSSFVIKRDGLGRMIDRSITPPKKFKAKKAIGIDYGNATKTKIDNESIPIVTWVASNGSPISKKFTHVSSLDKIQKTVGKPKILTCRIVNKWPEPIVGQICLLDLEGVLPWYRQGVDAWVFDNEAEAKAAYEFVISEAGKAYIDSWRPTGYTTAPIFESIFANT